MADMADMARERVAVLAPGGGYGTDGPLLMFSAVAADRRGAVTRPVTWDFGTGADLHAMVTSAVAAALDDEGGADGADDGGGAVPRRRGVARVRARSQTQLNGVRGRSSSSPSTYRSTFSL